jgi:hypothetical protein
MNYLCIPSKSRFYDDPYPTNCIGLGWRHPSDSLWIVPGTVNQED